MPTRASFLIFSILLARCLGLCSEPPQEIPFELKDGFIWIRVLSPQSARPLNFLLDSGAATTTLNLQTASRLNIRKGNKVSVRGVDTTIEGFFPARFQAAVGEVRIPGRLLVVDLSALAQECHCDVDGLLGADFFRGRIVQLDFARRTIRLLPSAPDPRGAEVLPLTFGRGAIRVPVEVNGKIGLVRLDTGCASSLEWVTQNNVLPGESRRAVGLMSISVPTSSATLRIGKSLFPNLPIGVHQSEIFSGESGLLGMGILQRFSMITVDCRSGRLLLQ